MKRTGYWLMMFGLVLLLANGVTALAQDSGEIPQITIEATADGLSVPEEMPAGIVQVTFENNSDAPIGPLFARLNEGVTIEGLFAALEERGDEAFLQELALLGYIVVLPGEVGDATFDFTPGDYLLLNIPGEEPEDIFPFTVADAVGEGAAPPEADIEIKLLDFAFIMPIEISAGPHVWHIENPGEQPHEMTIVRLDDDVTAGEFNEILQRGLAGEDPEEAELIAFWILSPDEQGWITYDLEPGTYGIFCGLPDLTGSGHVHAELGMRQIIIVTE